MESQEIALAASLAGQVLLLETPYVGQWADALKKK